MTQFGVSSFPVDCSCLSLIEFRLLIGLQLDLSFEFLEEARHNSARLVEDFYIFPTVIQSEPERRISSICSVTVRVQFRQTRLETRSRR